MKLLALSASFLALAALSVSCSNMEPKTIEAGTPPEMTEEQMMAVMQELGTPGEGHQRLQPIIGSFDTTMTMWMDPAGPPVSSTGKCANAWALGGRYVQSSFQGEFMGQPFNGLGWTGFDNSTKKYRGIWIDDASTMVMPVSSGTCDAAGKVFTFTRAFDDPMMGTVAAREVLTIHSNDHHTFDMHHKIGDMPELLVMKIDYQRTQ